jgi:MFS family permease
MTNVRTRSRGGIARFADVRHSLGQGLRYISGTAPMLAIFMLVVAHCVLTMSFDAMLPGFAEHSLHESSRGFTAMTMGIGVGALVGTFSLAFLAGQRGRVYLITGFVSGLSPLLMAASSTLLAAFGAALLMGASQVMFMALTAVFIQAAVPDAIRGRVMSFYLMSAGGLMAVANLGFGAAADRFGAPVLFVVPGIFFTVIMAATLISAGHLQRLYRTGQLGARVSTATSAA